MRSSIIHYNVHDLQDSVTKTTVYDVSRFDFKPRPSSSYVIRDFEMASEIYYTYGGLVICLKNIHDSSKMGEVKEL